MSTNLVSGSITRPGTGTVTRTFGARLSDTYNVRDFGADGSSDSPAIQAAINEAISRGGGTIYFPAGSYDINTRLVIPGSSNAALTLLGDGAVIGGSGSILTANISDYILYIGHSGSATPTTPVKLIQGLWFRNTITSGTPTSTEPPSSPDGTSGNGMGCLYIGSPSPIGIVSCEFSIGGGLCVFSASDLLTMQGCNMIGSWDNLAFPPTYSMGLIARGVHLLAGKFHVVGTCVELIHGISMIENMNFEVSGRGLNIGQNSLAYWEPDAASGAGAVVSALDTVYSPVPGGFANLQFESCGLQYVRMINVTNFILQASCQSFGLAGGYPTHAFYAESIRRCKLQVGVSGGYSVASIALGQGGAKGGGNLFDGCSVGANSQGGALWVLPGASHYNAGDDPYVFTNCDIDGGVTKANLPFPPSAGAGTVYVTVTNSDLAAVTGATSNVGRAITTAGPANNTVRARWNSQLGDYVIAG